MSDNQDCHVARLDSALSFIYPTPHAAEDGNLTLLFDGLGVRHAAVVANPDLGPAHVVAESLEDLATCDTTLTNEQLAGVFDWMEVRT